MFRRLIAAISDRIYAWLERTTTGPVLTTFGRVPDPTDPTNRPEVE